jgi:glycosyltransferase involved in cell wall biosynthesis
VGIVFVNRYFHPDHAATAQMLADLAFHAASHGHEVTVITSAQRLEDPSARLPARERNRGLCVHRVWTTRFGRSGLAGRALDYLTFHLSAGLRLAQILRPGDTVVAATDPPLLGVSVGWVARLRRARLVNWLHDVFPEAAEAIGVKAARGRLGTFIRRLRDTSMRRAACNVTLGDVMAGRVQERGVAAEKIRVIHNWSDGNAIRPLAHQDNALRRTLGLDDRVVVSYSGNLGRAHDLSSLADAARGLSDLERLRFLIIGGGAGLEPLRNAAAAQHLENMQFAPYQPRERLRESLAVGDIHLIALRPSLEGLIVPSKLYGVLAAGRASVFLGDPDGEVARVLARAACGITVAPGDASALSDALRRLYDDEELRRRMGRNARAVFEQRFDQHQAMQAWMEVLS